MSEKAYSGKIPNGGAAKIVAPKMKKAARGKKCVHIGRDLRSGR